MSGSRYNASVCSNGVPILGSRDDNLDDLMAYSIAVMEGYGSSANATIIDTATEQVVCQLKKDFCD